MADATTFNFELVSPDKVLVSEPAWQVTIPGSEGYFGVRAGHMSLIAALKAGVVEVYAKEGDAPHKIFIAGGVADVTAGNCTLLAEQATNVNELDAGKAESDLAALMAEQSATADVTEKTYLQKKIDVAQAKVRATKAA